MNELKNYINEKKSFIDNYLKNSFNISDDSVLRESADYSTNNSNSKRLRAILILTVIENSGIDWKKYIGLASSIEYLQTATLIHDDLPCMDNSDMRRGKASNHKKFSENISVLTGDFLFSYTFYNILKESEIIKMPYETIVRINTVLFNSLNRIIAGQTEELNFRGNNITEKQIIKIIQDKTACFIEACLVTGGIISGLDDKQIKYLSDFGIYFGTAYQISDDIIDIIGSEKIEGKKPGTDKRNHLCTLPGKFGKKKALNSLKKYIHLAGNSLEKLTIKKEMLNNLLYFATEERLKKYS
jgi:geranylgeranyl diphosphate synthase, type II